MSRVVITGGPGAGKTTLLLALQARGYTIVGDTARTIIQNRLRRGLSPRPNAYEFTHETLRMDISPAEVRRFGPGSLVVLEDTTGEGHITRIVEAPVSFVQIALEP